ncbi:metalloendopeptidase OMA1, mitochondrial-like isoform X1 [Poecilia formosa]|uniref:Metalloendopeptidase OMA1, mitochondrial n=3 Tax=Poecilia formosa TaxID=48698 RepID=A0A087YB70_POEFO|nr:PREDICTED: metalloendopeptidase OMA1, mitochondrial-like isoform X1 [Poecilia formosa]
MAFLCSYFLRNTCSFYFHVNLTRHFQLCKRADFPLKKKTPFSVCSPKISSNLRVCATRQSFSLCGNVRAVCSRIGSVQTQWGHHFHTSTPRRALPAPLLWMVLKPLQKLLAILLGRSLRKWWGSLPDNRRQLVREWLQRRRWHLATGAGVALVIVALLLLTHLDESPVTGRTRLLVFSREKYMELAALTSEAHLEEFAELLLPATDPLHQMVEQAVQLLAQRNKDIPEVSEVPWSVHVVESPQINAFVLPNGKVFMFTGMLGAVADLDQLMIVLGHEMAHAILDHSAEQASLSHVVDLLSLIVVTAIWALCPGDSLALVGGWAKDKLTELMFNHPYSRKLEAEADQVGLHLAAKACADVRAGPVFWQQLEIVDKLTGNPTVPEWLSTHPSHRNRSGQMDRLIPQALELRETCSCPALSPVDPRAVFSKTVSELLAKAKEQGVGGLEGTREPQPVSASVGLPVSQTALASPSQVARFNKDRVPAVTSPLPTAAGERSQHVLQNTNQQGS